MVTEAPSITSAKRPNVLVQLFKTDSRHQKPNSRQMVPIVIAILSRVSFDKRSVYTYLPVDGMASIMETRISSQ